MADYGRGAHTLFEIHLRHRVLAAGLLLKEPKRLTVPLSADEVATFWGSFRTFRNHSLIALMPLSGLRPQETRDLRLEDLHWGEEQLRVPGKEINHACCTYLPHLHRKLLEDPLKEFHIEGLSEGQKEHWNHVEVPHASAER